MSYRIGAYLIDPAAHEIRREDAVVPVEPQVFDLLIFLIENRQRTVSKDEIIERIRPSRVTNGGRGDSTAARFSVGFSADSGRLHLTASLPRTGCSHLLCNAYPRTPR